MRHRHTRVGRDADAGGHPGHDLERRTPVGAEMLRFLRPSAENVGVASFEPDDPFARPWHVRRAERLITVLRQRAMADRLSRADFQTCWRREVEQARAGKVVVNDHVGPRQDGGASTGQEPGIARPRADQVDDSPRVRSSEFPIVSRPRQSTSGLHPRLSAGRSTAMPSS